MKKRFWIGTVYSFTDWFTGGTQTMTVIANDGDYVTFKVRKVEVDGIHVVEEKYPINNNEYGEYILIYSYKGHNAIVSAYPSNYDIEKDVEKWKQDIINRS
jgi:signal peptidase I